jgi:molybdopterin synthase catalytic subunit
MFILQENPIDIAKAKNMSHDPADGALASFEGIVRADQNQNRVVSQLLYLADAEACIAEGEKIIVEALSQFKINEAVCIQRVGQLKVAECAIWR